MCRTNNSAAHPVIDSLFSGLEYRMRLPLAVFIAAGLVGCSHPPPPPAPPPVAAYVPPAPAPPTRTAPICARPAEKSAFDVSGLKSQLMVIAVSCHAEDRYNDFVIRYRGELVNDEKALDSFFRRAYGRRAQQEHDDYITQLANAQSELGLQEGTSFCPLALPMFEDVMALSSTSHDELPRYAAAKPIQQSLAVESCSDTPSAPVKPAQASVTKTRSAKGASGGASGR
jgi:hypothetical protein